MTSNTPTSAISMLSLLLLSATTCAVAQNREPVHLSGLINDYSPLSASVKGSPWEMHGQWSMVNGRLGVPGAGSFVTR